MCKTCGIDLAAQAGYLSLGNECWTYDRNDDHDRKAVRLDRVTAPTTTRNEIRTGERGRIFLILHRAAGSSNGEER
jgi:hypothetical protein